MGAVHHAFDHLGPGPLPGHGGPRHGPSSRTGLVRPTDRRRAARRHPRGPSGARPLRALAGSGGDGPLDRVRCRCGHVASPHGPSAAHLAVAVEGVDVQGLRARLPVLRHRLAARAAVDPRGQGHHGAPGARAAVRRRAGGPHPDAGTRSAWTEALARDAHRGGVPRPRPRRRRRGGVRRRMRRRWSSATSSWRIPARSPDRLGDDARGRDRRRPGRPRHHRSARGGRRRPARRHRLQDRVAHPRWRRSSHGSAACTSTRSCARRCWAGSPHGSSWSTWARSHRSSPPPRRSSPCAAWRRRSAPSGPRSNGRVHTTTSAPRSPRCATGAPSQPIALRSAADPDEARAIALAREAGGRRPVRRGDPDLRTPATRPCRSTDRAPRRQPRVSELPAADRPTVRRC